MNTSLKAHLRKSAVGRRDDDLHGSITSRIRIFLSSIAVLIVFVSALAATEWLLGYPIFSPIITNSVDIFKSFSTDIIKGLTHLSVPLYLFAVFIAVVTVTLAIFAVREFSIRRNLILRDEQYALTAATAQDGMWIWDALKDEEFFSPHWDDILGYSSADLERINFLSLLHPEDRERAVQALHGHFVTKSPYNLELRLRHKDDHYVWVCTKGQAAWDKDGNTIRMAASITEITERMRGEDALRRSHSQFNAIANNSPSLIYAMGTDSRLLMVNKAYQKFYGISQKTALNEGIRKWVGAENEALVLEADRKMLTTGKPVELQLDIALADGRTRTLQVHRFPIFDSQYRIIGIGGIDNDISEQNLAEQQLVTAMHAAESASRAKSEFVANMSHELRTPLNAIIGFSEIMAKEFLGPIGSPKYHEYAGDINSSGTHLLGIINQMLDLSKVEAGMFELNEQKVDVLQTIKACLTVVKGHAQERDVEIIINAPDSLPALFADERNLKQILVNLLTNSIKFASAGDSVTLDVEPRPNDGYFFRVTDTGIGIEAEDIPLVLTPFGQVESAISRTEQGTGLGLPLAKSMIELHGGSLDLRSTYGAGTTVTVRFPAERVMSQSLTGKIEMTPRAQAKTGPVEPVIATGSLYEIVRSIA